MDLRELVADYGESDFSAEDHLFAGQALIYPNRERALRHINKAIESLRTPIPYAVYAQALAFQAADTGDAERCAPAFDGAG